MLHPFIFCWKSGVLGSTWHSQSCLCSALQVLLPTVLTSLIDVSPQALIAINRTYGSGVFPFSPNWLTYTCRLKPGDAPATYSTSNWYVPLCSSIGNFLPVLMFSMYEED